MFLVKFQEYYVANQYKHHTKKYRGILLRIPKNFQPKIDPFIGMNFKMKEIVTSESADETILNIVLMTKKPATSRAT